MVTKPRKKMSTPIKWTAEDIEKLFVCDPSLRKLTLPKDQVRALVAAQGCLPKAKQRTKESLSGLCYSPGWFADKILKFAPQEIQQPVKGTEDAKGTETAEGKAKRAETRRWSKIETAMLAHDPDVKAILVRDILPHNVVIVDALAKAQVRRLPRERWRARDRILHSMYGGQIERLREALTWDNPNPPDAEPEDTMANSMAAVEDITLDLEPPPTLPAAPTPTPESMSMAILGGALLAAVKPMFTSLKDGLQDALARGIAQGIQHGLSGAEIPQRPSVDAADINAAVRQTIIDILGAPPPPAQVTVSPPQPPRPKRQRVDVVGLLGDQEQVVRTECGSAFDLRFIGAKAAEHASITAPIAVMCSKFVKHSAQDRIRKAGATLLYANGGAASVVEQLKTITQLQ